MIGSWVEASVLILWTLRKQVWKTILSTIGKTVNLSWGRTDAAFGANGVNGVGVVLCLTLM
jgi:hypothetical protein